MITVTLTKCEQRLAIFLAKSRHQNSRKMGIPNMKMGDQSDEATDLEGIGGELAFCKAANCYPDLDVHSDNLPAEDAYLNGWGKIDIKTTKYKTGRLLATLKKKPNDVDYYVLVTGEFPTYTIVGYLESAELIRPERIGDLGHGKGYIAEQDELKKFKKN